MNLNVFVIFYLLFISAGRCCSSKRSTGFICLAFTDVRVFATIMNNKSERDNQIENKEEGTARPYLNKSLILSMLKDLLFIMLKILTMVLFYRLLVYLFPYWKFIGIYIFNIIFIIILIYGISIFYVPDRSFYRFLVF
ncbi:hypothetical protein NBO_4g0058 [Nosema bombycis CQ1]|uniref:Uncharacterized protein n=1 Tax=Nosema bombycis (strain CQ1 / CVCC 102059) TaxID=578461 RepID=R0MMK1_NOSB1|nr:hypothetical protein NBO_4g0058 [Nosema bombycis CQ1]|eukprot:EOB15430.1 hypothetical protein NBO_4g0058 [Nosema bombycis CQ1]